MGIITYKLNFVSEINAKNVTGIINLKKKI